MGWWRINYGEPDMTDESKSDAKTLVARLRAVPDRRVQLAAADAIEELTAALAEVMDLLSGFDDADRGEDDEIPIIAPALRRARTLFTKYGASNG